MPLTAFDARANDWVEAFSVSDETWAALRAAPIGTLLVGPRGTPAIAKQNYRGTRWFQAMPGLRDPNWKPESATHQLAKIWMVRALREAGYSAFVERYGTTDDGEAWEADVFVDAGDRSIAFEIQISDQSFEDYLARTERYARSGVRVVWLVNQSFYSKVSVAAVRSKGWGHGSPPMRPDLVHMPMFKLEMRFPLNRPTFDRMKVVVWPYGDATYSLVSIAEFAVGVASGALRFRDKKVWAWHPANITVPSGVAGITTQLGADDR